LGVRDSLVLNWLGCNQLLATTIRW